MFPVKDNLYKLYTMMKSDKKAHADLIFDIFNERITADKTRKQCLQIGTAILNLHDLLEFGSDLEHQDIGVIDKYENEIGKLFVSIRATEALQFILQEEEEQARGVGVGVGGVEEEEDDDINY